MFQMQNNLAVIDYEKYGAEDERDAATEKCPRALLVYVGAKSVKTETRLTETVVVRSVRTKTVNKPAETES
jgi:hypothetical protein